MSRLRATMNQILEEVLVAIREGRRVRRKLPEGGRIFLDRPLPFLCLLRIPENAPDTAMERLISTESSYLILPHSTRGKRDYNNFLSHIAAELSKRFESLLLIEIWEEALGKQAELDEDDFETSYPPPTFRIYSYGGRQPVETIGTLRRALAKLRFLRQSATVEQGFVPFGKEAPRSSALTLTQCRRMNVYAIGIEIGPAPINKAHRFGFRFRSNYETA